MNNKNQIIFDIVNKKLEEGNILEYSKYLDELYNLMICDCFIRAQNQNIRVKHLRKIEKVKDNIEDYNLNLVKGFIYLFNERKEESYKYLTNAIQVDDSRDLPYSLRASIKSPSSIEDATQAVLLNPSARNYFVLGLSYIGKNERRGYQKSLIYLENSIKINPYSSCAYYNKALRFEDQNDLNNAIEEYIKCIEINPNYWVYSQISYCLNKRKKFSQAINYAKLGAKYHRDEIKYHFCLGFAHEELGSRIYTIEDYELYLNSNPDDVAHCSMEHLKKPTLEDLLMIANSYLHKWKPNKALALFEQVQGHGIILCSYYLSAYFLSLIQSKNMFFALNETNPIFKRLNYLRRSYFESIYGGAKISKEVKIVNELREYQSSSIVEFGEYNGENIETILKVNPKYILWCIINLDNFAIDIFLFLYQQIKDEHEYITALGINLIKLKIIEKWRNYEINYDGSEDETSSYCGNSYEKYGGYNGYSDGDIDEIFEGDPSLTWNID